MPATASASSPTTLLIPIYNSRLDKWDPVIQAKTNHPGVPMIAIIDPNGGPGSSPNTSYATLTQRLHSVGIIVIGYTWVNYGSRNISDVFTAIDEYKSWYNVDGIMIDQMSYYGGDENYYSSLTTHARSDGLALVIGNPGTETKPSYVGTVDTIILYEDSGPPAISYLGGWHANYDKTKWGILPYAINSLSKSYVASASKYVGYIYMSNGTMPNPWNTLPPYFGDLVAVLDPSPTTTTTTSGTTTTGAATSTSTVSSTTSTTTTTSIGGTSRLTVGTQDTSGATRTGYYTALSQNGVTVASGFTPAAFTLNNGQSYSLVVDGFGSCSFDHWLDNGSTGNLRPVSVTSDTTLTAVMNCVTSTTTTTSTSTTTTAATTSTTTTTTATSSTSTTTASSAISSTSTASSTTTTQATTTTTITATSTSTSPTTTTTTTTTSSTTSTATSTSIGGTSQLTVGTQDTSGATRNGYYTALSQNGVTVASGFTPVTFTLNNGQPYSLVVDGYPPCSFDHWLDNGSTGNPRPVSVTSATQLTADMNCGTSTSTTTTSTSTTITATATSTTTTIPSATVPSRPTGLSAKPVSASEIDLTWTPPASDGGSSIIGYQIEISTDGGTNWSVIAANTGSTTPTYSSNGLSPATTYTYRVSAINSVGTSDPSDTASATTYVLCVGICL